MHALTVFMRRRKALGFSTAPSAPLFVGPHGRAYGEPRISEIFLAIIRSLRLRGPAGQRGPRIHDFRHSFAVTRLATWYRQDAVLQAKLPLLTTYLGHTSPVCTGVYLQATAELLQEANKRFHRHCAIPMFREVANAY